MALVMGILLLLAKSTNMHLESLRLLLTVGFLGGFATFLSLATIRQRMKQRMLQHGCWYLQCCIVVIWGRMI